MIIAIVDTKWSVEIIITVNIDCHDIRIAQVTRLMK